MTVLKTPGEIELMDEANRIVLAVLEGMGERIAPGVTPRELDRWAERTIRAAGGVPAFLNYRGYPATLCISVDDVIVHGIPGDVPWRGGCSRSPSARCTSPSPRCGRVGACRTSATPSRATPRKTASR